jgi:hypothetical protein
MTLEVVKFYLLFKTFYLFIYFLSSFIHILERGGGQLVSQREMFPFKATTVWVQDFKKKQKIRDT